MSIGTRQRRYALPGGTGSVEIGTPVRQKGTGHACNSDSYDERMEKDCGQVAGIPSPLRRSNGPAPEQVWAWTSRLQTQPEHTERISVSAVDYVTSVCLFLHHLGTGTPVKGGNSLPNIVNKTVPINTCNGIFAKKPNCPEREGKRTPLRPNSGEERRKRVGACVRTRAVQSRFRPFSVGRRSPFPTSRRCS